MATAARADPTLFLFNIMNINQRLCWISVTKTSGVVEKNEKQINHVRCAIKLNTRLITILDSRRRRRLSKNVNKVEQSPECQLLSLWRSNEKEKKKQKQNYSPPFIGREKLSVVSRLRLTGRVVGKNNKEKQKKPRIFQERNTMDRVSLRERARDTLGSRGTRQDQESWKGKRILLLLL